MKKKILTYLYKYEPKVDVRVEARNNGILKGVSWKNFVDYLLTTPYKKSSKNRKRDFEDCLEDCAEKAYIFEGVLYGTDPNAPSVPSNAYVNYIVISSEGRKLARGWWITRWLYFFEFLFREHWLLYGILIFIGGLIVRDPRSAWDLIVKIVEKILT